MLGSLATSTTFAAITGLRGSSSVSGSSGHRRLYNAISLTRSTGLIFLGLADTVIEPVVNLHGTADRQWAALRVDAFVAVG